MSERVVYKYGQLDESEKRIYSWISLLRKIGWVFLLALILAGTAVTVWDKREHLRIRLPKAPIELREVPKNKFSLSEMG